MSDMAITFSVLGGVVVLFVSNRLPVELVALAATLTLWATGVLELEQSLAGFGDASVVFIASLFVVSEGLDATGVTTWAGQQLIGRVGGSRTKLLVAMMLLVALLTAVISVNGAVAALLPMVVVLAVKLGHLPSKLLMPLAFGAHAGSMLALTGTPVNVIVSEAVEDATGDPLSYFEFALIGVPLVAGTIALVVVLGDRLLPNRRPDAMPIDLSQHATTLAREYALHEGVVRLRVRGASSLVGTTRRELERALDEATSLLGVQRGTGRTVVPADAPIEAGDVIVVQGSEASIERLTAELDLALRSTLPSTDLAAALINREYGAAEVVIPPRSAAIGTRVFPGMTTSSGDLVILAVERRGEDQGARMTTLEAGDTLLLQGSWDALDDQIDSDPEVLAVASPLDIRRQAVPFGPRAGAAVAVLGAMVVLLATGAVPAAVAGLLAAAAMILSRVVTVEQAYRSVSWTTVVLVGAMIPLSTAMQVTGAAEEIAQGLVRVVGDGSPYLLAAGLFLVTMVLGQLISNMATALIVIPIAVSTAIETGVGVTPLLMAVNVAAAAAFLTPVATPVNMMVMGPAGYRFTDYWKLGGVLMAWFFVVSVFLVPVVWSF
jgi:di/tricarboxylate transporter